MTGGMPEGNSEEAPDGSNQKEMIDGMMKEFQTMMSSEEGLESFKNQFEGMMGQMISKESLYGPMKAMKDEFPKYLEENADKIAIEDLERYNNQLDVLEELIKRFDEAGDEKVP